MLLAASSASANTAGLSSSANRVATAASARARKKEYSMPLVASSASASTVCPFNAGAKLMSALARF